MPREKKKTSVLAKGSHLIMLSKDGFVKLAQGFTHKQIGRGHIDLVLKAWLTENNRAEEVGACYVYPQMGGYHAHESGCDPKNFGAAQGGRPSAWEFENPASGTRIATDPKQRAKYLIQWRQKQSQRIWKLCPTDRELVDAKWKWKSIREPTASGPSGSTEETQQEDQGTNPENIDPTAPRAKRSKRAQRQVEMRDKYRVWVDNFDEAAVLK